MVLVDDDLLEIRARTKHMSELITRADGHSLLLAGSRKATAPHAASKLFRRACVKFQQVSLTTPCNQSWRPLGAHSRCEECHRRLGMPAVL